MKVDVGVASDLLGYLLHLDRAELYLKIKQAADEHRGFLYQAAAQSGRV